MKAHLILVFIMPIFFSCKGQPPDWSKSSNWKIYKGEGQQVFAYSIDAMGALPHNDLNIDSIKYYLKQVTPISKDHTPVWMGAYLASYQSAEDKLQKVEISLYGGFFYDQSSQLYYSVPKELRSPWQKFINSNIPK